MKQVANSYSANVAVNHSAPVINTKLAELFPAIPGYVWLATFLLSALLLGVSSLVSARNQAQSAYNAHSFTQARLQQLRAGNAEVRARTSQLRSDAHLASQSAQESLHYVKSNEIVVATH